MAKHWTAMAVRTGMRAPEFRRKASLALLAGHEIERVLGIAEGYAAGGNG